MQNEKRGSAFIQKLAYLTWFDCENGRKFEYLVFKHIRALLRNWDDESIYISVRI